MLGWKTTSTTLTISLPSFPSFWSYLCLPTEYGNYHCWPLLDISTLGSWTSSWTQIFTYTFYSNSKLTSLAISLWMQKKERGSINIMFEGSSPSLSSYRRYWSCSSLFFGSEISSMYSCMISWNFGSLIEVLILLRSYRVIPYVDIYKKRKKLKSLSEENYLSSCFVHVVIKQFIDQVHMGK